MASITKSGEELRLATPYDPSFLVAFKAAIPQHARRWEKPVWLVAAKYEKELVAVVERFYGPVIVKRMQAAPARTQSALTLLRVEYIGACKGRDDGTTSAYGYTDGGWNAVFPEGVLRAFFKDGQVSDAAAPEVKPTTLYARLGIEPAATLVDIKTAYKRLARVWHPDINQEPDAPERFRQLNAAYETLAGPQTRRRYDAGLALEASLKPSQRLKPAYDALAYAKFYRAPLTCGMVEVHGHRLLGRTLIDSIDTWRDIVDKAGRTAVSSWPKGAEHFITSWIESDIAIEVSI